MSWSKPREVSNIKLCHNHKDHRKGAYVFKIDNGVVDKKHQRFFCFESTKIRRVSKAEKKALEEALAAVAAAEDKAFSFLVELIVTKVDSEVSDELE